MPVSSLGLYLSGYSHSKLCVPLFCLPIITKIKWYMVRDLLQNKTRNVSDVYHCNTKYKFLYSLKKCCAIMVPCVITQAQRLVRKTSLKNDDGRSTLIGRAKRAHLVVQMARFFYIYIYIYICVVAPSVSPDTVNVSTRFYLGVHAVRNIALLCYTHSPARPQC